MPEHEAKDSGEIRAEIAALKARFEERTNSDRPASGSLIAAYEALLDRHYRRLDQAEKQ
jgi:hypothetical protein